MAQLYVGAHVIIGRTLYSHHGIYIGENKVIHYSGLSDGLSAGPIEITTLESFVQDGDLTIRTYSAPKYTSDHAVRRAKSRLGENKYDLHANNCEHFCTWVVMDTRGSAQVDFVEDLADIVGGTLGTILRARRHTKQGFDREEFAKSAGKTAATLAISAVFPMTIPVTVAYKALRWIFK
jgi:Lecithin retinol acyltransferase